MGILRTAAVVETTTNYMNDLKENSLFISMTSEEEQAILTRMDGLFLSNKVPKVVPYAAYERHPVLDRQIWANRRGFYSLPTLELASFIKEQIAGRSAHEIGAGHSAMAKHLGIYHSDPRFQEKKGLTRNLIDITGAIPAYTPPYVSHRCCKQVLKDCKPQVLLAQWVTPLGPSGTSSNYYGPDYKEVLEVVETLIFVGNLSIHPYVREVLGEPDIEIREPWIVSRSMRQEENILWVWNRK